MEENIVTQAVFGYGIVQIVALIGNPVVIELLRTKYQHRLIAVLIILDDRKSCKGLTQTYTIGKDTTVVLLQLIDDGKASIFLEVIELIPNLAFLESSSLFGQIVFGEVIQELTEYIVKCNEIEESGAFSL